MSSSLATLRTITARDFKIVSRDGTPRLRDMRLAGRLGFKRLRKIRELVERNKTRLERLAPVACREAPCRGALGGYETEYWLTSEQAIAIAFKSEAEDAIEVQDEIIRAVAAYLRGEHPEMPLTSALLAPDDPQIVRDSDSNVVHLKYEPTQPELFPELPPSKPDANQLSDHAFWEDVPQMVWSHDARLRHWFKKVGPDGRISDESPALFKHWFLLPLELRQRWWAETNYSKTPPGEALLREVKSFEPLS
jgi:hypothetical protein